MTRRLINYTGWAIILAASLYFINDNAFHYFSFNKNAYNEYWPGFAPSLLIHIIAGMTALLIGPFQFIPAIRNNYPTVHRTMGKIYLCSIVIAGTASLYLSVGKLLITDKAIVFGAGLAGLAFAWLLTSGMAYWAVHNKNFVQHREWMVRSFVVTCGFTSFRLIDKILVEQFHMDGGTAGELMAWACWAFPLMITEVFLQAGKIKKGGMIPISKNI